MRRRALLTRVCTTILLLPLLLSFSLHASAASHPATTGDSWSGLSRDLFSYAGQYQARVAGLDTGLPPQVNGHDEFAARWAAQMLSALHGLSAGVVYDNFATPGFRGLPTTKLGANVIVVAPGSQHPDHAVLLGSHYDGEPFSHGSAFDDTSGSVVMLTVARQLGALWRQQGPPSLSVVFALFDGEEQGLVGSTAYSFAQRMGAVMPNPVLMIDEEQSGIGYPARPFGLLEQPPLLAHAVTNTPLPSRFFPDLGQPKPLPAGALKKELAQLREARTSVFAQLHRDFPSIAYRGGSSPAFTPSDQHFLTIGKLPVCCSDNAPFQVTGIPTVTLSGSYDYYSKGAAPWEFPYDQPEDTPQAMACDTGGSPQPGAALEAALAVPAALSIALTRAYAPPRKGSGAAVYSTLLGARKAASFHLIGPSDAIIDFGDGTHGHGSTLNHVYARPGTYTITVKVSGKTEHWRAVVHAQRPVFHSSILVKPPPRIPWKPVALQDIAGCH